MEVVEQVLQNLIDGGVRVGEIGDITGSRITVIFQSIANHDLEYGWDERFEFHLE
ncbi:hypothetical protein [Promicromonospora panici]|uniref:hypothetical protein n=1 Tax=Promicromonospora panici TaxID=2219658 RepID=UPI0013EA6DCD|nr:hypothetical protein [Promicromonospora panici]